MHCHKDICCKSSWHFIKGKAAKKTNKILIFCHPTLWPPPPGVYHSGLKNILLHKFRLGPLLTSVLRWSLSLSFFFTFSLSIKWYLIITYLVRWLCYCHCLHILFVGQISWMFKNWGKEGGSSSIQKKSLQICVN